MSSRAGYQGMKKQVTGSNGKGRRERAARGPRNELLGVQQKAGNAAVSSSLAGGPSAPGAPPAEGIPEHAGQALRSPGRSLDPKLRQEMEGRFQRDFRRVQVHTGSEAARSADQAEARAYTVGNRIVFSRGEYAPGTSGGKQLVAHELAHVVQQSQGGTAPAGGPTAERQAAGAAQASLSASPVPVRAGTGTAPGIARVPKKKPQKKPTMRQRHEQHKRSWKQKGKKPKSFRKFGRERIGMGKYGPGATRTHHLLPQEILKQKKYKHVARYLQRKGINVHRWVADIPNDLHKKIHQGAGGGKWNKEILDWLDKQIKGKKKPSLSQIRAKINGMMKKHGFPKRYRNLVKSYGRPERSSDFYKKRYESKRKRRMERGKKKAAPGKKKKGPPPPKKPGKKPQLKKKPSPPAKKPGKKPPTKPKKPGKKPQVKAPKKAAPKKPATKPKKPPVKPKKPKVKAPKKFKPKFKFKGKFPKPKVPYYDVAVFVIALALGAEPAFGMEGMSSEEAIFKALTEKGVKVSPELEELIKGNPALAKKLEQAAKKGKLDDESKAAAKRFYDFLQEHIDELDEETLERLIALGQGVDDPKLAATREQMEAALEAAKAGVEPGEPGEEAEPLEPGEKPGAGGKGEGDKGGTGTTGAGKTGKAEEEAEEVLEGEAGPEQSPGGIQPAGEKGEPGVSKIPPELRKRLKDAPEAVRRFFESKTEFSSPVSVEQLEALLNATPAQLKLLDKMLPRKTEAGQVAVDESVLLRTLQITAGLTEDQLEKLLKTAKPVGKESPEEVLKKLEAAVAGLESKPGEKKPGTRGEPAPGGGKPGGAGGKPVKVKKDGKPGKPPKGAPEGPVEEAGKQPKKGGPGGERKKKREEGSGAAVKTRTKGGREASRQKPKAFTGKLEGNIRTVPLTLFNIPHNPPARMTLPVTYGGSDGKVATAHVPHKIEVLSEPENQGDRLLIKMRITSLNQHPVGFPPFTKNAEGQEIPEAIYEATTVTEGEIAFPIKKKK